MTQKFYQLTPKERRQILQDEGSLKETKLPKVTLEDLDTLSENVVGQLTLPVGVVKDLLVNGRNYTVPMASEEPSVVAAANHGAKILRQNSGATVTNERRGIFGQAYFQVDAEFDLATFETAVPDLVADLNTTFASLQTHGGGVREITPHLEDDLLELRVLVDPAEAMGANKTNSILENLSQQLLDYPGIVDKLFAILSNYPSQFSTAEVKLAFSSLVKSNKQDEGQVVAEKMVLLSKIAQKNPYRATTNNKGIMNGVDAVLLATGNDFRAVEVAAHAYAGESGVYTSLSKWEIADGQLVGHLTLPLAIGVVGGSIKVRADVKENLELLGKPKVAELSGIITAVGLANNLAALLAISTKGIQAGHMKLQAKNLALTNGATNEELPEVVRLLIKTNDFSSENVKCIIACLRGKRNEDWNRPDWVCDCK